MVYDIFDILVVFKVLEPTCTISRNISLSSFSQYTVLLVSGRRLFREGLGECLLDILVMDLQGSSLRRLSLPFNQWVLGLGTHLGTQAKAMIFPL